MRVIQVVVDHMDDTLKEAYSYYKDYIIYKDMHPKVAMTSLEMAQNHLNLYSKWHEVVVALINEHKIKHGDIPKTMQELYDYEHKKLVEDFDEISYKVKNARNM